MKKVFSIVLFILLIGIISGCSKKLGCRTPDSESQSTNPNVSDHFIFIDDDGVMRDKNNTKVIEYEGKINSIYDKFDEIRGNDTDWKMTIYIHGGLNSFEDAKKKVKNTYKRMLHDKQYPVFICWKSGEFSNYGSHLFEIRNGEKDRIKAIFTSPFILAEDMLRSIARIPISWGNMIEHNALIKSISEEQRIADNIESGILELCGKTKKRYLIDCEDKEDKKNNNISNKHDVIDYITFLNPVKFITSPFLDAAGKGSWQSMLRRTDLVLNSQKGFDGSADNKSLTAAYYFLFKLNKKCKEDSKDASIKDTKKILIGHSMGTIIANNILTKFPDINFDKIVYMAAACKIKDLETVMVPWMMMEKHKDSHFYNLSLHPHRDIDEKSYFDFIPRGSLLIWIDDFLGEVNSFQDRTAGFWFNIIRSAEIIFPIDIRDRVHLTKYGIKDCSPQEHGDFNNFNFWNEDFWNNKKNQRIGRNVLRKEQKFSLCKN